MKFIIKHEIKNRIRIHLCVPKMSYHEADLLLYYLTGQKNVTEAKVYERTGDAVICYKGDRLEIIRLVQQFSYEKAEQESFVPEQTGRELNAVYKEKLIMKIVFRSIRKLVVPMPIRRAIILVRAFRYAMAGIKSLMQRKMDVSVLDATAIIVSLLRKDFETASSVMFMLGIGELLEEWTHKKSVDDLARSMSLNISKVWLKTSEQDILVPITDVQEGDIVTVHMGSVIPLDGIVVYGEGMVNQASLTGEPLAVLKKEESYVYAGTVLEEGELEIKVRTISGATRYEKIVRMIEESEKLKSALENKAENLADKLVPYTLGGTLLTYLLTRNVTRALSILMVDFSCALKLAMPIAVLSAMREAGQHHMTVKGGKYLEAVAEADTVVFDKTGTLTKAQPTVVKIVPFNGEDRDEMLRVAACLEEHFPHSMANAVVEAAINEGLEHQEMHSKVEYIVAHGISSYLDEKRVIIGSYHFVFEDEKCVIPETEQEKFAELPGEYSHLFMAIDGVLSAVICINDPIREEVEGVIKALRESGIDKVVMMTGDSKRNAKAVAKKLGLDEFYAEVLPEDKAKYIEAEKALGRKVIMIGDGINDSPALSAANVGIAINDGAQIAREIADITISADSLYELVRLRNLSTGLMKRIGQNYRFIVGFNLGLILLGVGGIIQPSMSALLHNGSTLGVSMKSMQNLLEDEP